MGAAGGYGRRPRYRLTSIRESAKLHLMGPDYAAVVTACAAHLWLQPLCLHRAVTRLESAMTTLENNATNGATGMVGIMLQRQLRNNVQLQRNVHLTMKAVRKVPNCCEDGLLCRDHEKIHRFTLANIDIAG